MAAPSAFGAHMNCRSDVVMYMYLRYTFTYSCHPKLPSALDRYSCSSCSGMCLPFKPNSVPKTQQRLCYFEEKSRHLHVLRVPPLVTSALVRLASFGVRRDDNSRPGASCQSHSRPGCLCSFLVALLLLASPLIACLHFCLGGSLESWKPHTVPILHHSSL